MLNLLEFGSDTANPPILVVHGLFGSARNWNVIAKHLSQLRKVVTVDLRNHGHSPKHPTQSYADMASDLVEVIEAHGGPVDVIGHSMGGKTAMVLALTRPDLLRRLVVADIAPVAYTHTQVHLIHAMRGLDLSAVSTRRDADQALQAAIPDAGTRAFLLQSLDVAGKEWRLNLDTLERDMDQIIGWPEIAGSFEGPTFMLSGALSDYVQPDHRPTIKRLFPNAKFAKIPGAGHWLHADKPREFEASVAAFLNAG